MLPHAVIDMFASRMKQIVDRCDFFIMKLLIVDARMH